MKKHWSIILVCLCGVSLVLNFLLLDNYLNEKNKYDPYRDWTEHSVKLRLDKERDIFADYAEYLTKIMNNTGLIDDLANYARAVTEFSSPEIVGGAVNQREEEHKELGSLLTDILAAGAVVYPNIEKIAAFDNDSLQQMRQIYADLHYLLNANNEENSFNFYLQSNDFTSEASRDVQNKIKEKLAQLNELLEIK